MEKSIHTDDYATVTRLLVDTRKAAEITQVELAELLEQSQSFVSKVERGETRLDIIQLRTILQTLGTPLSAFVDELEQRFAQRKKCR